MNNSTQPNTVTIKTNRHPHDVLNSWDLTPAEAKEFAYLDLENDEGSFFRYKGQVYDLGEFMRISEPMASNCQFAELAKWDGYASDSYFSGLLVKYVDDECEQVIVATYFS